MTTERIVRDKLFDGVGVTAFGLGPLGVAVALAIFHGEVSTGVLALTALAAPFLLLGALWITRKITFSPTTLSVTTWLGERAVNTHELASLRIKKFSIVPTAHLSPPGILVACDRNGLTLTVNLQSRAAAEAAQAWLAYACDTILGQWSARFAEGQTVTLDKRTRLTWHLFENGKARIQLDQPFSMEEIPAGPSTSALLRISQGDERIAVNGDLENYLPLRAHLRREQSAASPSTG